MAWTYTETLRVLLCHQQIHADFKYTVSLAFDHFKEFLGFNISLKEPDDSKRDLVVPGWIDGP